MRLSTITQVFSILTQAVFWSALLFGQAMAQSTSETMGATKVYGAADNDNANLLMAQEATLAQAGTMQSLSFYVTRASGKLVLGVYDATGPGGRPGKLLAQTNAFTTVTGWNTQNVTAPVSLTPGNYWLAYLPSSYNLGFRKTNNTGNCTFYGFTFGSLPATYSTAPQSCTPTTWSFYATLALSTGSPVNGICGSANGTDVTSAPTANLCSSGTASSVTGSGPFDWTCAGSNGGSTASCSANLIVNGSCGPANGVAVNSAPASGLCSSGTATSVTGSGPFNWDCDGSNGGTNSSCSAPLLTGTVNGSCGSANGVETASAPTTNLCSTGTASGVTENGTTAWDWTCAGSNGGTTASCSAPVQPAVINGACGSANGLPVTSAPATNLCSTGTATVVSGTGPWTWACDGSNGGSNASCSAPLAISGTIAIGDNRVEAAGDNGNANLLLAQQATLSQTATIQSLSFYVATASGSLILGIYDSTGPSGGPGKLLAQTNAFTTVAGWNTQNVTAPVSLAAGNYWLAYLPSSNTLSFRKQNNSGNCTLYGFTFGSLPATYSTAPQSCTPTTWSFYATLALPTGSPVNGACGSANGTDVTSAPTANLCSSGTASSVTGSGPFDWTCVGSNGGTTASCSAFLVVNGTCGSANGVAVASAPTSGLCSSGTATSVTGSGPFNWNCDGSNGGTNASCSAPLSMGPVNGVCGSANGVPVASAPATNLCSVGAASAVSGMGPWTWTCAGSNGGNDASCQAPVGNGLPVPVLIQHVASSSNPFPGNGIPGNNFKIPLPNPVLAGDVLVLAISYPNGSTPAITDNLGNTWPSTAACTADNGNGNMMASIYVLPNSHGGTVSSPGTITVGFGSPVQPFQYTISEFNNVAASSTVDGCKATPGIAPNASSALIDPGPFTPSGNDGSGGNLIWNYTAVAQVDVGAPRTWTAATGFTLLDGDILETYPGFPHASQWYVQPAQAAVDPSITSAGDTADLFNSVTVALRIASAGGTMPSGIHINKVLHFTSGSIGNTWTMQAPVTGNLRVIESATPNATWTVTDNDSGSSWTVEQGSDNPQVAIAFAGNGGPMSTYQFTLHLTGSSPQTSLRFYDIQGAAASPFDVAASMPSNSSCASPSVANSPSITPGAANGLTIAGMPFGQGPGKGVSAPANAVFDLATYSGETDLDTMENADASGHFYNADTSAENWTWLFGSVSNGSCQGAEAVHFNGN